MGRGEVTEDGEELGRGGRGYKRWDRNRKNGGRLQKMGRNWGGRLQKMGQELKKWGEGYRRYR